MENKDSLVVRCVFIFTLAIPPSGEVSALTVAVQVQLEGGMSIRTTRISSRDVHLFRFDARQCVAPGVYLLAGVFSCMLVRPQSIPRGEECRHDRNDHAPCTMRSVLGDRHLIPCSSPCSKQIVYMVHASDLIKTEIWDIPQKAQKAQYAPSTVWQ